MSRHIPQVDPRAATAAPISRPAHADYSDEISTAEIAALRQFAPQDESLMGALVHEFRW